RSLPTAPAPSRLPGFLPPGQRHRGRLPVTIAAGIDRPILEPLHETRELADGLLVGFPALLRARQLGVPDHAALRVTAGPGDERGRPGSKQIHPVERALLQVDARQLARTPV